jgi:hypothetical protein
MDGLFIVNNVHFYLKAGGFYMISTKVCFQLFTFDLPSNFFDIFLLNHV